MSTEQTYIMVKPDGVQRGLVGEIIGRFEKRGYKVSKAPILSSTIPDIPPSLQLVGLKMCAPGQAHLESHYEDLKEKAFFPGLIKYMNSGPVVGMVWEGLDAVKTGRSILGATNPLQSAPGTIRGDFALAVGRNVCHGSDTVENAQKEINLWFGKEGVTKWAHHSDAWVHEK